MTTLLNQTHPYLKIYDPVTEQYHEFVGGKLEIEEGDQGYEVVMAEAARNPLIAVYKSVTSCPWCGDQLPSKAKLEEHTKELHFDKWLERTDIAHLEARNVEIKSREGFPCDVCRPPQVFGTEADLGLHIGAFHTAAPVLDEDGNEKGSRAPASTEIPAAQPSTRGK